MSPTRDFTEQVEQEFKDLMVDCLKNPVYLLDEAIDWIQDNIKPEDVFPKGVLHKWAKDEGYVKKGE